MTNVQQPEMRRSGHDRLVMDSAKERAARRAAGGGPGAEKDTRPTEQRSSYGPDRGEPESREAEEREAEDGQEAGRDRG